MSYYYKNPTKQVQSRYHYHPIEFNLVMIYMELKFFLFDVKQQ